jgi:hypothetical protein
MVEHEFLPERRLIRTRWQGRIDAVAYGEADDALREHPRFDASFDQLVDLREIQASDLSAAEIQKFVDRPPVFSPSSRRALVVSTDLTFGLARMFEQMRVELAGRIRVFRDLNDAERWLDERWLEEEERS